MRFLHSVARLYNTNFDRRPVATLVVTNGVLNTIADVLVSFPDTHHPFFFSTNLIIPTGAILHHNSPCLSPLAYFFFFF